MHCPVIEEMGTGALVSAVLCYVVCDVLYCPIIEKMGTGARVGAMLCCAMLC